MDSAEALGHGALEWLLRMAKPTGTALVWPSQAGRDSVAWALYQGGLGVVTAMLEGHLHFGDDRYGDAALRGAQAVVARLDEYPDSSLYNGLTGVAFVLRATHDVLGDEDCLAAADKALTMVRDRHAATGTFETQVGEFFDLMWGNAGIALGALHCGDVNLAVSAVEPYTGLKRPTLHGVRWPYQPGDEELMFHVGHGTLGVAHALVATGHAAGRADLVELGLAGVADVVAHNETDEDGFLVPYSAPYDNPDRDRHRYGWCNGVAGDAQTFRFLTSVNAPKWSSFVDRCWHSIRTSGLPERLRPGFWDNNGRCCGTAGVLALACDRIVETGDGHFLAERLVASLAKHATIDADGTYWSNHEHRTTPSDLPPRLGWAHGSAGIIPELLRYVRVVSGRDEAYAARFPDRPRVTMQ